MKKNKFNQFYLWMKSSGFTVSEDIDITTIDSISNYGVKALTDIQPGACLFTIPRTCLLSVENASLKNLISENMDSLASDSGWIPLLITLAYESTLPHSKWTPYLNAVPNFENLELPLFWKESELESYCSGTGVIDAVIKDNSKMKKEFTEIYLPFLKKHPVLFSVPKCQELSFYKQLVAFVMAYSFTEPEPECDIEDNSPPKPQIPFMVPMADMLNHSTPNNAALIFDEEELRMEAILPISAGEQVFNTYGDMANWQLLHMHGFSLSPGVNDYDSCEINLDNIKHSSNLKWKTRWSRIHELNIEPVISYAPLDQSGFMNTEELASLISIVFMSEDLEFDSWCKEIVGQCSIEASRDEFDPWETSDEDVARYADLMDSISTTSKLPQLWKSFIIEICTLAQKQFINSLSEDETALASLTSSPVNNKQRHSLHVRIGQLRLIDSVLNAIGSVLQ